MTHSSAKIFSITSFSLILTLVFNLLALPRLERPDNVHDGETVIKEAIGTIQHQALRRSPRTALPDTSIAIFDRKALSLLSHQKKTQDKSSTYIENFSSSKHSNRIHLRI